MLQQIRGNKYFWDVSEGWGWASLLLAPPPSRAGLPRADLPPAPPLRSVTTTRDGMMGGDPCRSKVDASVTTEEAEAVEVSSAAAINAAADVLDISRINAFALSGLMRNEGPCPPPPSLPHTFNEVPPPPSPTNRAAKSSSAIPGECSTIAVALSEWRAFTMWHVDWAHTLWIEGGWGRRVMVEVYPGIAHLRTRAEHMDLLGRPSWSSHGWSGASVGRRAGARGWRETGVGW